MQSHPADVFLLAVTGGEVKFHSAFIVWCCILRFPLLTKKNSKQLPECWPLINVGMDVCETLLHLARFYTATVASCWAALMCNRGCDFSCNEVELQTCLSLPPQAYGLAMALAFVITITSFLYHAFIESEWNWRTNRRGYTLSDLS